MSSHMSTRTLLRRYAQAVRAQRNQARMLPAVSSPPTRSSDLAKLLATREAALAKYHLEAVTTGQLGIRGARFGEVPFEVAVTSISPLLADAMTEDIRATLAAIPGTVRAPRPHGGSWGRAWHSPETILLGRLKGWRKTAVGAPERIAGAFERSVRRYGILVRSADDPSGGLGVSYRGGCLDISILRPRALLMTWHGVLKLAIDGPIPETVAIAAPGRPVGDLIDHPLLNGRDYPIASVEFVDGVTVISASAPSIPLDLDNLLKGNQQTKR